MNTFGRGGQRPLRKKITVFTNDAVNPKQFLTITGKVDKLYTLSHRSVRLEGTQGAQLKKTISLITEEKYPLSVLGVRAKEGENIRYQLEEVKEGKITRYELVVENLSQDIGRYRDTIYLKTDNKIQPEIRIQIIGKVKAPPDTSQKK